MCQGKVLCNWECQLAKVLCLKAPVKNKAQLGSFAGEAILNGLAVLVCQLAGCLHMYITTDSVPAIKLLAHHHLSLRLGATSMQGFDAM